MSNDYLTIAFDQIHQGMSMLRLRIEATDDPELMALIGQCDVALLKPLRKLRLRLGVPYFEEGDEDE